VLVRDDEVLDVRPVRRVFTVMRRNSSCSAGVAANIVVLGIAGYVAFKINDLIFGLRTTPEAAAQCA